MNAQGYVFSVTTREETFRLLVIGYLGLVIQSLEVVAKPLIDPREKEETLSAQVS